MPKGVYKDPEYMKTWRANNLKKRKESWQKWYAKNGAKRNADRKGKLNNYHLKKYGVSDKQYEGLLTEQHGVCAICHEPEKAERKTGSPIRLSVDHCHATGKVRGLLCQKCNTALGMLDDSTAKAHSLITYLEQHTCQNG